MTRRNAALREYLLKRAGLVPELAGGKVPVAGAAREGARGLRPGSAPSGPVPAASVPEPVTLFCPDCGKEVETKLVKHFTRIGKSTDTGMHQELLKHECRK